MIERILPEEVAVHEEFTDPPGAFLLPAEEELVRDAVPSRRREFVTGRHCARQAMARLGVPAARPVLQGRAGEPLWPAGVKGSITHCRGYRAAAVTGSGRLASLGIDAEPDEPLKDGILETVALPEERRAVRELLHEFPGPSWDRLLFSAKESVYKAWYPLGRRRLDFLDASVVLTPAPAVAASAPARSGPVPAGPAAVGAAPAPVPASADVFPVRPAAAARPAGAVAGRFTAELRRGAAGGALGAVRGVPTAFTGRWTRERGAVVTAVVIGA